MGITSSKEYIVIPESLKPIMEQNKNEQYFNEMQKGFHNNAIEILSKYVLNKNTNKEFVNCQICVLLGFSLLLNKYPFDNNIKIYIPNKEIVTHQNFVHVNYDADDPCYNDENFLAINETGCLYLNYLLTKKKKKKKK